MIFCLILTNQLLRQTNFTDFLNLSQWRLDFGILNNQLLRVALCEANSYILTKQLFTRFCRGLQTDNLIFCFILANQLLGLANFALWEILAFITISCPILHQKPSKAIMSERKAVIKNADMSEDMQQDAVDCATTALEKYNIEKDIAAYIKKEFDKKYNPTWHCIVGRNFGSYVTHETKHFIYFYLGQVAILLFKSG